MLQLLAVAVGILLGAASGLVPGIHSNTIASVLSELMLPPELFPYIIVAVLGAHLVFSFFPSVFLSIPDDTVVASVLPGNRLALEGRGKEAISVCVFSAVAASAASALLIPAALWFLPIAYAAIEPNLAFVLLAASAFLLLSEREAGKILLALGVFSLSGLLGLATMRIGAADPLFSAFSGLFASSGILLSLTSRQELPAQKPGSTRLDFLPFVAAGVLLGMLSDLLPGIAAPAQIAVFASAFLAASKARQFLALVSSIAASHAVFSFAALASIGKAREGSIAIMQEIAPMEPGQLPALVGVLLVSIGIAGLLLSRATARAGSLQGLGSKEVGLGILAYLICAVAIISGAEGLLIFATATAVGLLPPLLGVRRTHVMGLIIVPSIMLAL